MDVDTTIDTLTTPIKEANWAMFTDKIKTLTVATLLIVATLGANTYLHNQQGKYLNYVPQSEIQAAKDFQYLCKAGMDGGLDYATACNKEKMQNRLRHLLAASTMGEEPMLPKQGGVMNSLGETLLSLLPDMRD